VEAALVIPLLLMVVFGIIDFGRMLNAQLSVTEAAREGARVSSFGASPTEIQNRVDQVMDGATVVRETGCLSTPDPDRDTRVRVNYQFDFVTPVGALAGFVTDSFTLTARGVMPCHS
jgi:Flp pilus assembly protein TadG